MVMSHLKRGRKTFPGYDLRHKVSPLSRFGRGLGGFALAYIDRSLYCLAA